MTAFKPIWQINIGGVNYTEFALSNLSIGSGRSNIYEQAYAGYCNVTLINLNQAQVAFDIQESITISLQDSNGDFVPIFGGEIVDIGITVQTASHVALTQSINIIAVGALARLPKALTNGVLTKALDGVQIESILR